MTGARLLSVNIATDLYNGRSGIDKRPFPGPRMLAADSVEGDSVINRVHHEQRAMPDLPGNPLQLHARYAREQVLVGFGATTFAQQPTAR